MAPLLVGPLGLPELVIILVVVIIIFGVGRLPEIGGALGKGIKEFRKASREEDEPERRQLHSETTREEVSRSERTEHGCGGRCTHAPACGARHATA
jgi:sec-independent protein translocase protein TatA